jgi:hypothetical protein
MFGVMHFWLVCQQVHSLQAKDLCHWRGSSLYQNHPPHCQAEFSFLMQVYLLLVFFSHLLRFCTHQVCSILHGSWNSKAAAGSVQPSFAARVGT